MSSLTEIKRDNTPRQKARRRPGRHLPKAATRGFRAAGIHAAVQALWPAGVPVWLTKAERDAQIVNWLWERKAPPPGPNERTIRRYFNERA